MADRILFLKTQVAGYTRKDGTFVRPHTDKRPQPEQIGFQFREPTGGDQVKVFPYASGMSRKRDMHAAIESAAGVGTEIGELSDAGMTRIAEAVAAGKPVFVDSGAFNAFKRAIREGKPENARLDFERVFAKYNELSRRVREHSSEYADHALLMMVAPDVIGDQEATLELIEEHAEQIMDWIEAGHDVIVPFQKGPINQYEAFLRVREALHHLPFVVGIPSAAEALSAADLREMLAHDYKPDRIHVLGAISSKRMEERMAVIRDAYVEDVPGVTADAMVMRSKLHELGGLEGQAKFDKIKEILDRVVPEIWGGTLSKSFLEGNDDDGYFTAAVIFAKADLDQAEKAEDLIRRHRGEPTPEQAKSGNYPKRAMKWQGLTIRIENEAGSIRRGVTESGMEWEVRMTFPYGEFSRTEGVDGDPVDVIVGPDLEAPMVYVVHQRRHGDWENYDEDKVCIGFDSEGSATAAFLSNYNDPRFLGPVTAMPVAEFIAKVKATRKAPAMIKAVQVITRKDGVAQRYHVSDEPKPEDEQMLADDMEAQIQWLEAQATGMGYAGVEDMVANNYQAFETLAAKWREDHPVDVALKSFAEELLKARVGPYIRQGKLVNLAGYDGKSGRAEKAPGQASLFSEDDAPAPKPKAKNLESKSPPVVEDRAEMIKEHERLVQVLESPSHEDDKAEAKRQREELEEYKQGAEDPQADSQKSALEDLGFRSDIPKQSWLDKKVEYAKEKGKDRFGVPYMGTVTGSFRKEVRVPVSVLAKLRGMRGEQDNVRHDDLDAIKKIMSSTGKLPLTDSGKEYAPFLNVAYDGTAWVNEGNHRIMAAAALGWDSLPVEIRYFDGGELVESGPLHPGKIAEFQTRPAAAPMVAKVEAVAPSKAQQTRSRRQAVLDVLGDGWTASAGVDGARDAYRKVFTNADGGKVKVLIMPQKSVDGNFYIGAYNVGGSRPGAGGMGFANTIEEAKAVAEKLAGAGKAAPKVAKVEAVKPSEDLEKFIKVAADSIDQLRRVDVMRVLESNGTRKVELARYIADKRPDLAKEVGEVMEEEFGIKDWQGKARNPQADYKAALRSTKQGPTPEEAANPRRKFYVTIAREGRGVALLAGPFETHDEALAMVDRAKEKAYEVDPKSHFDAFGTSGVESDNHKPGVLNDQLGLGVLQPVASDDSHPAPIPRMSIAGLPEGDRERWKALHREQHETRYWHMANQKLSRP